MFISTILNVSEQGQQCSLLDVADYVSSVKGKQLGYGRQFC